MHDTWREHSQTHPPAHARARRPHPCLLAPAATEPQKQLPLARKPGRLPPASRGRYNQDNHGPLVSRPVHSRMSVRHHPSLTQNSPAAGRSINDVRLPSPPPVLAHTHTHTHTHIHKRTRARLAAACLRGVRRACRPRRPVRQRSMDMRLAVSRDMRLAVSAAARPPPTALCGLPACGSVSTPPMSKLGLRARAVRRGGRRARRAHHRVSNGASA
jgi:hypothetical protein